MSAIPAPLDFRPFTLEELAASAITDDSDYRRGYTDGYEQAMSDMRDVMKRCGYSRPQEAWNILGKFHDDMLYPWRLSDRKRYIDAPVFKLPESWGSIRLRVFERDGNACVQCGNVDGLECDHIREVRNGGLPDMDNLRTLCGSCHRSRKGEA